MRAELKSLHSPDADPLRDFAPVGPFGLLVQAMIGPHEQEGYESFDFMLCTPEWFASNMRSDIEMGDIICSSAISTICASSNTFRPIAANAAMLPLGKLSRRNWDGSACGSSMTIYLEPGPKPR